MRYLIAILLAFAITACASVTPQPLPVANGAAGSYGAATLSWGPFEDQLAPAYTRVSMLAQRTERRLRAGAITRDQAVAVSIKLKQAYALLNNARASRRTADIGLANAIMDTLEGTP